LRFARCGSRGSIVIIADSGLARARPPRLVGRQAVLAELQAALSAVTAGTGGCLVVEGPDGIGKSRVLAVAAEEAQRRGVAVAAGRATELDGALPLTALLTALRRSIPPVLDSAGLAELAASGTPHRNRFLLVDQLAMLLEDYVRTRALLIVLDDAQWADELTALTVRMLVPTLRSSPVLWLFARRPLPARVPAQHALDWLVEEGARRLPLDALPAEAMTRLCADVLHAEPGPEVLELAARAGGNPFLLLELLEALRAAGRVRVAGGVAGVVPGELPATFLTAVDYRLRDLSADALRLLEAGSVFGRPFTLHEVAGLLGRRPVDLLAAAEQATGSGALVNARDELDFRHDLIREAVHDRLTPAVRLALHREAVSVLRAEGRSAAEVAAHLRHSARSGDEQAAAVLHTAARELAQTAPGAGADLLLRRLQLLGGRDPARREVVAVAVRLLAAAGRLVEARQLAEQALREPMPAAAEAAILLGLAEALKHAGQDTAALECTRRALSRDGVPDGARANLSAIQGHAMLVVDDLDGADTAGRDAVALGGWSGTLPAVVFGAVVCSAVARARGELDLAVDLARNAVEAADAAGGEARQRHPRLWLGRALTAAERFDEADAEYWSSRLEEDELGTAWSHPLRQWLLAELRFGAGRLEEAAAEAEAGAQIAEQIGALALMPPLLATLGQLAVRRGELDLARSHLRRAQLLVSRDGLGVPPEDLSWQVALHQDAAGDPAAAVRTLDPLYRALPERLLLLSQDPWAGPQLVRIALRAGATAQAEAAAAAATALSAANPGSASPAGAAEHAAGLLRHDLPALRRAVRAYRPSRRPLAAASAIEDTAAAEAAAGNRTAAADLLEEALQHYTASGASWDAARVVRRRSRLGVRRGRAGGPTRPPYGWEALTESELRVARLVAQGFTNRAVASQLCLSPHTVDTHLRHMFAKLGVSSRVELTRQVVGRGAIPEPG
jgi:DNA-binding CsgD family transcriptional regulator/tetratricopeptide (TPR) repeat protein